MSRRTALLSVVLLLSLTACHKKKPGNVVGTWMGLMNGANITLTLNDDNTWSYVGSPPLDQKLTFSASGTYVLTGTSIAYTPTQTDVSGPLATDQRDEMKKQLAKPETDEVDFTSPDEFVESAANGEKITFHCSN
jgi:triacylglycerol esterase/lipase EstA (alpha/beta hydrolase family)